MNRRNFLRLLSLAASTAIVDPEKLLWVPGKKTIFIPSAKQVQLLASDKLHLYGIPYHTHDGFSRTWIGIPRTEAFKELAELIKELEEDKANESSSSTHS